MASELLYTDKNAAPEIFTLPRKNFRQVGSIILQPLCFARSDHLGFILAIWGHQCIGLVFVSKSQNKPFSAQLKHNRGQYLIWEAGIQWEGGKSVTAFITYQLLAESINTNTSLNLCRNQLIVHFLKGNYSNTNCRAQTTYRAACRHAHSTQMIQNMTTVGMKEVTIYINQKTSMDHMRTVEFVEVDRYADEEIILLIQD